MPYIDAERKRYLDAGGPMEQPGDLTYVLTKVLLASDPSHAYKQSYGGVALTVSRWINGRVLRYADYAVILGCLDSTWREFARRYPYDGTKGYRIQAVKDYAADFYGNVVVVYEDSKIEANGDVFPA